MSDCEDKTVINQDLVMMIGGLTFTAGSNCKDKPMGKEELKDA